MGSILGKQFPNLPKPIDRRSEDTPDPGRVIEELQRRGFQKRNVVGGSIALGHPGRLDGRTGWEYSFM